MLALGNSLNCHGRGSNHAQLRGDVQVPWRISSFKHRTCFPDISTMTLYERFLPVLNSSDMLLSVVGACTQIPSDVILPRGRRNHISPPTRLTLVLFILIPKQITGIAIPLLHGVVVITSEKRPLCTCKTE